MSENISPGMSADTSQLEQLIRELNNPVNQGQPEKIHVIQKQIQRHQRDVSAWQIGLDLLDHPEAQIRFFGALTLTIKVNADWETDKVGEDREAFHKFLECLVTSYVRLATAGDALFVLQKLCTTLVAVFQKPNSAWAFPVRHVFACAVLRRYVKQNELPSFTALFAENSTISVSSSYAALLVAQTIAEESGVSTTTSKAHNLQVRTSNNLPDVWSLLHYCTDNVARNVIGSLPGLNHSYRLEVRGTPDQLLGLAKLVLSTIPHWTSGIQYTTTTSEELSFLAITTLFQETIQAFLLLYSKQQLTEATVQAFSQLEQTSHKLLLKVCPGYAEHIVRSIPAGAWVSLLLEGDFEPEAVNYVDFLEAYLGQIDVTSSDYLQTPYHLELLNQVQRLLGCSGIAGIDDIVCPLVLDILSPVVEGFGDWPEPSEFDDAFRKMTAQACSTCFFKIRMPQEELELKSQTWGSDDRAIFQDFRYDVHDFLQNAFGILGSSLIEEIIKSLLLSEHLRQWHVFEADIFSLLAFIDTMSGDPAAYDGYLEAVLTSPNWSAALDSRNAAPDRVRQQMIKFIGEITSFLQRHPQQLISSLNFLFEALHIQASTNAASRAISTLCDAERTTLVEALPQFMSSLGSVAGLESDARNRIFGGVSSVIQALPSEQAKLEPLSQVLTLIETGVGALLGSGLDVQEYRSRAADMIHALAAIGKGLRQPSDGPDESRTTDIQELEFWTHGPGLAIQNTALRIYGSLYSRTIIDEDSAFVEATCEFLRSAFTENHPSPLRFPSSTVVSIMGQYIHPTVPQPDLVMGTVSSYFATADISDPNNGFASLLSQVLFTCEQARTTQHTGDRSGESDYQAAILEMMGRILPKWGRLWVSQSTYEVGTKTILETAINLVNDANNPLSRRAAAYLFSAFLESSARGFVKADIEASTKIHTVLQQYGPRIFGTLLHLLGGECPRSDLDNLTDPLKKFMTKQPLMANRLMKEAMKEESGVLSPKALAATKPEQRMRFAAQVEMLRGARKTNDVLKEFWVACRGSSFGYVG